MVLGHRHFCNWQLIPHTTHLGLNTVGLQKDISTLVLSLKSLDLPKDFHFLNRYRESAISISGCVFVFVVVVNTLYGKPVVRTNVKRISFPTGTGFIENI